MVIDPGGVHWRHELGNRILVAKTKHDEQPGDVGPKDSLADVAEGDSDNPLLPNQSAAEGRSHSAPANNQASFFVMEDCPAFAGFSLRVIIGACAWLLALPNAISVGA